MSVFDKLLTNFSSISFWFDKKLFSRAYRVTALYIDPESICDIDNFFANNLASVLFPDEEGPSIVTI